MKEDAGALLGPDDPIPCEEWLATQFASNNCRILMNEQCFGRIDVVRKIQKHAIIKHNADGHYSNACLKAARKFDIEHESNAICVALDDKNKMKFGAPGEPLALSHKSKRKQVAADAQFLASDHDMSMKSHAIPSLMGKIMWNEDNSYALGKFYDAEVTMILKDGASYPFSSFQHAAELIMNYNNCKEEHVILQADGGHDHNCANSRNIASFLMIMNELKLQHLIAMKNAGGYSMRNLIETPIATIAFGMQCLALA